MAPTVADVAQVIGAATGVGAAIVAAIAAYLSLKTARSADESVKEARAARKAQIAPRLVLHKNLHELELQWEQYSGRGPYFLARKHANDEDPSPATLLMTNYGTGPALEIQLDFSLDDPNGSVELSESAKKDGVYLSDDNREDVYPSRKKLCFEGPEIIMGYGVEREATLTVASCAPGETREIGFPLDLYGRLFVRGLQHWERRMEQDMPNDMVLTAKVASYSIEGDRVETQFRFRLAPYQDSKGSMLIVASPFEELPMYARQGRPQPK